MNRILPAGLAIAAILFPGQALADNGRCSVNGATKIAASCDPSVKWQGCCSGTKMMWCEGDGSALCYADCGRDHDPSTSQCGWVPSESGYACTGDSGEDPAKTFPRDCAYTPKGDCANRDCGTDGAFGFCGTNGGTCAKGQYCTGAQKCGACSCDARECGPDQCGAPCGGPCPAGKGCDAVGKCVTVPLYCLPRDNPGCPGCECEACVCKIDDWCCTTDWDSPCVSKCTGSACKAPACPCIAGCTDRQCGSDGCGGTCGLCGAGKYCDDLGRCLACPCKGNECGEDPSYPMACLGTAIEPLPDSAEAAAGPDGAAGDGVATDDGTATAEVVAKQGGGCTAGAGTSVVPFAMLSLGLAVIRRRPR